MELSSAEQPFHEKQPLSLCTEQQSSRLELAGRSLDSHDISSDQQHSSMPVLISSARFHRSSIPSTSSSAAAHKSSSFLPECTESATAAASSSSTEERGTKAVSSLVQLLTAPKTPAATILHRPTPIHPAMPRSLGFPMKTPQILDTNPELPLDLSQTSVIRQHSVIIQPSRQQPQQQQQTFLPTCANPSLNSNWITIKFSAAATATGSASTGPNRMSYPREFKLMVINYYYTNGQNKYRTCKEFQITKSMLNGWLRKIDKIRQSRPGSLKSGRSGRKPQFPDIEKQLFDLYHAHLGTGKKVGNRWIRETARNLAQQQCSEQELAGMCQFSERWLSNFKKRYRINLNRDWSSGNSSSESFGSLGSSVESIGALSSAGDSANPSPDKPDEAALAAVSAENESTDSDAESILSESLETLIDIADESKNSRNSPSFLASSTFPTNQEHIQEILNKPGQLPIQAFYERFPWLCRRNQPASSAEPGRRGRKVQFPGVEKLLFERLQQQQSRGERISNRWLQQQARELAVQICPKVLQEATKSARCLFSEHWLHNFKKRYGVTLKQAGSRNYSNNPENHDPETATATTTTTTTPAVVASCVSTTTKSVERNPESDTPTDLSTVLRLQNWFLTKCYNHQQQSATHLKLTLSAAAQSPAPSPTPSVAPPIWYPTPLQQSLL